MPHLLNLVRIVLNTKSKVTVNSLPADIAGWDSVKHLELILAIEDKYNLTFTPDEIAACAKSGIPKIIELLVNKGINLTEI